MTLEQPPNSEVHANDWHLVRRVAALGRRWPSMVRRLGAQEIIAVDHEEYPMPDPRCTWSRPISSIIRMGKCQQQTK